VQVWEFAWSPDAKEVAAVVSDEAGEPAWYHARLAKFAVPYPPPPPAPGVAQASGGASPSSSSSSSSSAAAAVAAPSSAGGVTTLWQWHGPYRQLAMPVWSPSGASVAFISSVRVLLMMTTTMMAVSRKRRWGMMTVVPKQALGGAGYLAC
jgi:hypothetical protein